MPFVEKHDKGFSNMDPFIVLFIVYTLAIYNNKSPFWINFAQTKKFGKQWVSKHSNKNILPVQLVQLGFAHAYQNCIFKSHRFGQFKAKEVDWYFLTEAEIAQHHKTY